MANKAVKRPKAKRRSQAFKKFKFSRNQLVLLIIIFAVIGYPLVRSFAAGVTRTNIMTKAPTLPAALSWLAAHPKTPAYIPPGTYNTTAVLDIPAGSDVLFDNVTIVPKNAAASAVRLRGDATILTFQGNSRIGQAGAHNSRLGNAEAAGIELEGATHATINADNLTIEGVAQDGVFLYRQSGNDRFNGKIAAVNTGADSFHVTDGSHDIEWVASLTSTGSGDDGFAVVSYISNEVQVSHVHWHNITLRNQKWGRGVSVVGGNNVVVDNADIQGSAGAGVYIAAEPQYNTFGVEGVTISGKIRNPNTQHIHNANVVIYSAQPGQTIADVTINVNPDPAWALVAYPGNQPVTNVHVNAVK